MMSSKYKLLLLLPSLLVTSCGYGLKEIYSGVPYASSVFSENYYDVWQNQIDYRSDNNQITETKALHVIDDSDHKFTSLSDQGFKECDEKWVNYAYTYDKTEPDDGVTKAYGPAVSMFNYDDSFKYGVSSKLFDGQMFCNGDFQNARTQVRPNDSGETKGFSVLFSKECNDASYFMMNFKCSVVTEEDQNLGYCTSNLKIILNLYLKNESGYTRVPLEYSINNVPTNSGDDHFVPPYSGRNSAYVCFGFNLKNNANIPSDRLVGMSIQYEHISDTYSSAHPEEKTLHALMLYEVSFPYTTWH